MNDVVIVAAGRTAIGNLGGSLAQTPASSLGAHLIASLMQQHGISPGEIDEVILGQVLTGGTGQNPARQAAILGKLPVNVPAFTINKVCGSGLKTVQLGTQAILLGDANMMVVGGQETMSLAPHLLPNSRTGLKMGNGQLIDSMVNDGLWDAFNNYHMGRTAENIAKHYAISREEQDAFAANSQRKAEAAQKADLFHNEIIAIDIKQRRSTVVFDTDEFPRHGTTAASLGNLKPAFDPTGTVTAGNASGINDGAAILILTSAKKAKALGLTPLARIAAYANSGVEPSMMGIGPVSASKQCLSKAGWSPQELDLIEANEAFAAQAIAVNREMDWDTDKVNIAGGAIALGHPIGASGARILTTLVHQMHRTKVNKGLATLCIGGGQGTAIAIERV